ncbi:hypothetical protein [Methylibium sp.]
MNELVLPFVGVLAGAIFAGHKGIATTPCVVIGVIAGVVGDVVLRAAL